MFVRDAQIYVPSVRLALYLVPVRRYKCRSDQEKAHKEDALQSFASAGVSD